jgi:hypothetical protein
MLARCSPLVGLLVLLLEEIWNAEVEVSKDSKLTTEQVSKTGKQINQEGLKLENRTSQEGLKTAKQNKSGRAACPRSSNSSSSGGKPPFLTCSF